MIYIKLFEAFIQEPVFYRFSHVDLLNGKTELIYHPKERGMMGPEIFNSSLVEAGFPDKKKCIHFMNSLAFDPSYKSIYGKYTYNIQVDDNSHLGWSFLTAINNWFYRTNPYHNAIKNPICKDLLNTEFKYLEHENEHIDEFDVTVVNRMRDILIECGLIGTGTIEDLKSSKYFRNQPVYIWTSDEVEISTYQNPPEETNPTPYKTQPILTKNDFKELNIDSNMIPLFYNSEFGKKITRFKEVVSFELRRKEALNLLKKWKESL